MIINSCFSVILECVFWGIRILSRSLDKWGEGKTKCSSEQQYINLYAGPEYLVHFRYSMIMNITFITMMYGTALPILFPVAFISYVIIYLMEVYMLFYVYRRPVTYDARLYKSVLGYMQYASLISLGFSGWQLSNNQLLPIEGQEMELRRSLRSPFFANHFWWKYTSPSSILINSGPALPIIYFFWIYLGFMIFKNPIKRVMKKFFRNPFEFERDI